jgi:hypothetical protein
LVCDCRRDRGGDCGGCILATQPAHGTFYASGDKSTGDYLVGSVNNNNAAKTVTSDTHLYTVHMCGPLAGLPFRVVVAPAVGSRCCQCWLWST